LPEAIRGTVAIVDYNHAARDSLQFLLKFMGYPVESFASTAEFLNSDIKLHACLILDNRMPLMTGLELAAKLRADGAGIPILLITGLPSPAIRARAAELGINRVLEKPLADVDLLDFISATPS